MSWAEEDWTVGLSGRILQKVRELQVHHERSSRENKQKQLLLDNIQTSLEKQTVKYEEVRAELQSSQRELQSVREEAKVAVTNRERLSLDLQTKHAQVCSLEGQLDAARSLNNKLTQEVKRLEADLEKLQNSSRSADATLFSTPCWSSTSPWELSGRKEERHGNRDEGKTEGLHIRRLQFSDMPAGSLPHQPKNTPHRQPPDLFSTPLTAFPWERDDSKPAARRQSPVTPKTPYSDALSQNLCGRENSPNNSEKDSSLSELRSRFTDLEEELRVKAETLKSIQNEVVQNKKDLAAKELNLQKLRDELSLAHTRMAQESERASGAEQRAKQLQEELKCQRQNSESIRVQHLQRTKELEKQHQQDLQEFQKERQYMERQHQQEINKLNQELAQARTLHNALQAQADKVSLQKQALDKEVDTFKDKLKWTEGQLQQSQMKEAQTQAKLTEALREAAAVTVSLKLSQKKEKTLEEDGRRLTEERDHAQHLLKELQEQNAAMIPLQQTLSFTQASHPSASQPPRQTRRPTTTNLTKQRREEEDRRGEMTVSYPADREPGEGIDSEHISDHLSGKPESLHKEEPRIQSKEEDVLEWDSSQTDRPNSEKTLRSKQVMASEDLQAENAALRSELRDVREELQKRLDDLEAQRRAETEARTRLKQLSRKNANQVTEKEEQYKECRTQLEKEKSEVERLKKALAALETEMVRETQERVEKKHEEVIRDVAQDREDEMIELNMQLKKQLSEVKSQLALEREERNQEEEEMRKETSTNSDLKEKLAELQAEIEQLKGSRNNISQEENLSVANSPLTYLTLCEDELNSNVVDVTNKPEHLLFCQSTNQRNVMLSQAAGDFNQQEGTLIDPQYSPVTDSEGELPASNQEDVLSLNNLEKSNVEEQKLFNLQSERSSDLATQVQRLQKQNAVEKERANQYQIKLEALQSQVTRQTQQLTMAFEKQSQHISGLLTELQEKECVLLSTEQELKQCKADLSALKAEINKEGKTRKEEVHNHNTEEAAFAFSVKNIVTDNNVNPQRALQLISDVESVVDSSPQAVSKCSVESDNTIQEEHNSGDVGEMEKRAVITAELFNLLQENQLLKVKIEALTATELFSKNTEASSVSSPEEQAPKEMSDITVQAHGETQQSNVNNEHTEESEEQPEAVSPRLDQISYLQQQVVALQTKLRALFEENQQKTQELALWRLASEPAPTFVQSPASTESDTLDHVQGSAAGNPQSSHKHETEHGQAELQKTTQESNGCVTLVREDELLLSCSSTKLQGRTLFSRLQHNVISEPKTHHSLKKTLSTQEPIQDHPESNKENTCPTKQNQKKDLEHVTKDASRCLGLQQTETIDCPTVNLANTELNPSMNRSVGADMRCVSTQTERQFVSSELQCVHTQTEVGGGKEEMVDSPSLSPVAFVEDQPSREKMMLTGSFPIPSDPARLAERIRRNRTQLSAAFDDTEYEPYGLPEVVMKGFADIPSGPSCPYIVRRGLLGTAAVPVPQRNVAEAEETD